MATEWRCLGDNSTSGWCEWWVSGRQECLPHSFEKVCRTGSRRIRALSSRPSPQPSPTADYAIRRRTFEGGLGRGGALCACRGDGLLLSTELEAHAFLFPLFDEAAEVSDGQVEFLGGVDQGLVELGVVDEFAGGAFAAVDLGGDG